LGVKSDLLKWEIIYRFGGVYADVDFECLQPLDELHYLYDFYTAYQPFDAFFIQLGAALYAGYPGHPILKHCIETIKDDWHEKGAPKKSGPVHFSKSFMATAGKNGSRDIAFPAFYFYPQGSTQRELFYDEWVAGGAYAIHHWAKSWMPVNYRRKEFRTFDNEQSSKVWND
jgi:mannosyltransferase OCH1-like enzyme